MKDLFRGYGGVIAIAAAAVVGAYHVESDSGVLAGLTAVVVVVLLGLLEAGLSLESAAANAKVLGGMGLFWRRMFVVAGVLVAFLGMRFLFPMLLVWAVSDHGFWTVASMLVHDTRAFQEILKDPFILLAGFGGAFLCMAFAQFFLDRRKEEHWIRWIERPMGKLGRLRLASVVATVAVSYLFSSGVPGPQAHLFLSAAMLGIVAYLLMDLLSTGLQASWDELSRRGREAGPARGLSSFGFASMLYLVLLGASLSFGVVIGAFSLTSNLLVIILGLGVGALFSQRLSFRLVPKAAPRSYAYLKHGVSWANGVLSLGLYLQAIESAVPEVIIGTVGTGFIGSSLLCSLRQSRSGEAHRS